MAEYTPEHLRTRVTVHEPGIVILREVPTGSPHSWNSLAAIAEELAGAGRWGLVVDLSEVAARPDANYREALKASILRLSMHHLAVAIPGSILLRATSRVLLATYSGSASVHKEVSEAIDAVRTQLGL